MSACFDTLKFWNPKINHAVYFIGLSETGLQEAQVCGHAAVEDGVASKALEKAREPPVCFT